MNIINERITDSKVNETKDRKLDRSNNIKEKVVLIEIEMVI